MSVMLFKDEYALKRQYVIEFEFVSFLPCLFVW